MIATAQISVSDSSAAALSASAQNDGFVEEVERPTFPRSLVDEVFKDLWNRFDPMPALGKMEAMCVRLCGVGGYRRRKKAMKDLELLFIPRVAAMTDAGDLFGKKHDVNVTDRMIEGLVADGVLTKRHKVTGAVSAWGPWIKHAVHVATGLPVDLFAATAENWHNRLVVTTGPKRLNIRISEAARALVPPWEWEVNSPGFVPMGGTWESCTRTRRAMRSEPEVFAFVGMPYLEPEKRR